MPPTNLGNGWNSLCLLKIASYYLVFGHLSDHSRENGVSALELSRALGISYNATWRLKHKLMQAMNMKERDDEVPLSGIIQLDDAYWGGAHAGKVGRGAAGKRPFVAAVSLNKEGHPLHVRFSAIDCFKKNELTQWAKKHLRPSSLVVSDGLACFRGVEEAKSFHLGIVTGGGPDVTVHQPPVDSQI